MTRTLQRLEEIDRKLREAVQRSMPAGLKLAQKVLDVEDEAQALAILEAEQAAIDDQLVSALLGAAQKLEDAGQADDAQRVRRLYRTALRLSMQTKMKGAPPAAALMRARRRPVTFGGAPCIGTQVMPIERPFGDP
jgi:hypothetical protein